MTTNTSSTSVNDSDSSDGVRWRTIQSLPKSDHSLPKSSDRQSVLAEINQNLIQELRSDDPDNKYERSKPATGNVWYSRHTQFNNDNELLYPASNGFYESIHAAWAYHGQLLLSPDDIWIAIQLSFSRYMELNAEVLRDKFVEHEGKKEIMIRMNDAPTNWSLFVERVIVKMNSETKVNMDQTFIPPFSSSNQFDYAMKHLAVMDHMKQYFTYRFRLSCGITKVGFLGSLEDWKLLKTYVTNLKQFDAGVKDKYFNKGKTFLSWINELEIICDRFIDTYNGKDMKEFWNNSINKRQTHGSGASTYIKGWIITFVNPLHDQTKRAEMDVSGVESKCFLVPVIHDNNGAITHVKMIGGFTGFLYDSMSNTYRPQRSFAVIEPTNHKEKSSESATTV